MRIRGKTIDAWVADIAKGKECGLTPEEEVILYLHQKAMHALENHGRLLEVIVAHNQECILICGDKSKCGYQNYQRNCGNCSKDWMIDLPHEMVEAKC